MLTAAFLILLTLTVGPFVFGFLRGLAGHRSTPVPVDTSVDPSVDAKRLQDFEEHLRDDDDWFFFNQERSISS
jgi:hypothetical protein